jgi:cellulose biosynthesis protein BcsQ
MEAVASILATITKVQHDNNPTLHIEGFLLTMYDARTNLGTEISTQVRGLFKENTFLTSIPAEPIGPRISRASNARYFIPSFLERGLSLLLARP